LQIKENESLSSKFLLHIYFYPFDNDKTSPDKSGRDIPASPGSYLNK